MRYRLTGYTPTDVFNATGTKDNYESFLEAFADDCRDDWEGAESVKFISGDAHSIVFEIPEEHVAGFNETVADLNPGILEKLS